MLNWLYTIVTKVLIGIHAGLSPLFGYNSGVSWGLSVVLLTVLVRLLLFPLFVKQIHTQKRMQELGPKMNELKAKYKNDKQRLNQEVMALYKENGANPIMGCLPLIAQMPFFWALFHVLRHIAGTNASPIYGWTENLIESAQHAKVFGVPLSIAFTSGHDKVLAFNADPTTVKIVAPIAIVIMAVTTFITQRQIMARNATSGNPVASQMKMMMYVLPPMFALFGLNFPMGVLLYWVSSNLWSMGQQFFVLRTIHKAQEADEAKKAAEAASVVIRRQQRTTRQPRSKRTGARPVPKQGPKPGPRPERPGRSTR